MIQTFRNKALERLLKEGNAKGVPKDLEKRIRRRLEVIDSATAIDDLKIPGYDLHQPKGDRRETWSIKVSGNWRITFTFINNDAYDLNLEDYH
ncbi:MAG: Killer protein [Microcystis novacekii Mn_MB_F_20050700_S1]|uniref:Killer protein n=1 Tax=Microcystis novacekii Mn_MB_F_20050700_S1D TaxID=2486266 RepID=A0A552IZD0_9CHRO|nr:MAG: Killer protein [Microcystis novacekii Mn_MB_F_20050700_S1D]TRU90163.1 MAG: Killer protein [Microcystis novacekii Mn_MB_F_20050700_S1]